MPEIIQLIRLPSITSSTPLPQLFLKIKEFGLKIRLQLAFGFVLIFGVILVLQAKGQEPLSTERVRWVHVSSEAGQVEPPSAGREQTASLILDIDQDGLNDFVIAVRDAPGPSLVWYRQHSEGWDRYLVEGQVLPIEAGGTYFDIDADGDLDIVMGGDYRSSSIWWWENPYPEYAPDKPWVRREIKNSGANRHHDMVSGDFTGRGKAELVFWNQDARSLMLAEVPANPRVDQTWPVATIYQWQSGSDHEGLAAADIDGDGRLDIIGGGRWFKHTSGTAFSVEVINDSQRFTRTAVGQLKPGSRPQVVFVAGDVAGPLKWYEWTGTAWVGHSLLSSNVDHGHSLEIADIDGDGHLDIFAAEMRLDGGNPDSKMWIFYGDGQGNFDQTEVARGFGNHESKIGDLTGDGRLDILGKPYNWDTPRLDIWINSPSQPLNAWQRHVIDENRPGQAVFITAADLDGDGWSDIITGAYWYRNPGEPGEAWERRLIGAPLNNMAAVFDFDQDGHMDVLGTGGQGSEPNSVLVWARNDGTGNFTVLDNVDPADGDFLQGVAVERFDGQNLWVALSWHAGGKGVQRLAVPADPLNERWTWAVLSPVSQDEALSAGDIDRDGKIDLLLGTIWLKNGGPGDWTPYTLFKTDEMPDRNRLAYMNGDGRLDAVIGYEAVSQRGKLAWYEQGVDPTALWTEHIIADPAIIGPMSLDVADIDGDSDLDVVVGEHNPNNPQSSSLFIFENADGLGLEWIRHIVYVGDEHHDGAQLVDIYRDGDLDIISIGWTHGRVNLYENKGLDGPSDPVDQPVCRIALPLILYSFDEGSGSTIYDLSPEGPPLNLSIQGPGAEWLPEGGLRVSSAMTISSLGAASKLTLAVQSANAVSLAAWVRPLNTTQDGPARIVSISGGPLTRNLTLGQGLWGGQPSDLFDVRLRTTRTSANGEPSLSSSAGSATADLTLVVLTRTPDGESVVYVNGTSAASGMVSGDLSNWEPGYPLLLANESDGSRPWLGEYHRLALYACSFSPEQVMQMFNAGPRPEEQDPDVNPTGSQDIQPAPLAGSTQPAAQLQASPLPGETQAAAAAVPENTLPGSAGPQDPAVLDTGGSGTGNYSILIFIIPVLLFTIVLLLIKKKASPLAGKSSPGETRR